MRRALRLAGPVLAAALAAFAAPVAADTLTIGYLALKGDPRHDEVRSYTGVVVRPATDPFQGAETALREGRIPGRALDLSFALDRIEAASAGDLAAEAAALRERGVRCTVLAVCAFARSAHTPCTAGARRVPHGDLHACPSAPRERSDQHRWRAAERRRRTENAENAWRTGSETITQPSTRTGCRSPRQCCTRRHLARQPGRQQLCSALAR